MFTIRKKAPKFWETKNLKAFLLWPISCFYQFMLKRDKAEKQQNTFRPSVPTVCIGNMIVGGSGKTPLVALLCEHFTGLGHKVAIISRGYGGANNSTHQVTKNDKPEEVGDEPCMLLNMKIADQIWVGPERSETCQKAIDNGATILVLDDGFQHWKLERDLDIVVIDGKYGMGNGFTLPAGPMREPISGLERANFAVVVNSPLRKGLPVKTIFARRNSNPKDLTNIFDRDVILFCGIGLPQQFIANVEVEGIRIVDTVIYPDHHFYTQKDLDDLLKRSQNLRAQLVTTPKDAIKLPAAFRKRCHIINPTFEEEDKKEILSLVESNLGERAFVQKEPIEKKEKPKRKRKRALKKTAPKRKIAKTQAKKRATAAKKRKSPVRKTAAKKKAS